MSGRNDGSMKREHKIEHASFVSLASSACGRQDIAVANFYTALGTFLAEEKQQPFSVVMSYIT